MEMVTMREVIDGEETGYLWPTTEVQTPDPVDRIPTSQADYSHIRDIGVSMEAQFEIARETYSIASGPPTYRPPTCSRRRYAPQRLIVEYDAQLGNRDGVTTRRRR